jgi:hypothetical protein
VKAVSSVKNSPAPKKAAEPAKKTVSNSVGTFSSGTDDWEEF